MLGPLMCGVKRKYEEMEGAAGHPRSYPTPDVRQNILNISMCKLRTSPIKREPSLLRSVLIFNTLRHIELELRHEGVPLNPAAKSSLWQQSDASLDMLDPPPGAELPSAKPSYPPSGPDSNHSADFSQLYSNSLSGCREATPDNGCHRNDNHPSQQTEAMETSDGCYSNKLTSTATDLLLNSDKLTISSFASLLDLDKNNAITTTSQSPAPPVSDLNTQSTSSSSCSSVTPLSSFSSTFASSALSSLTSSLSSGSVTFSSLTPSIFASSTQQSQQDIFGDIDLTMYDFDLLSSSSFAPSMKLAPLSAEELMHSFPVEPLGSIPSASPCYKNELLGDDFDHIMQVLVGI